MNTITYTIFYNVDGVYHETADYQLHHVRKPRTLSPVCGLTPAFSPIQIFVPVYSRTSIARTPLGP